MATRHLTERVLNGKLPLANCDLSTGSGPVNSRPFITSCVLITLFQFGSSPGALEQLLSMSRTFGYVHWLFKFVPLVQLPGSDRLRKASWEKIFLT